MNRWTAFFLILLRLVIGWHFLFEGIQKVESVFTGNTETNRPFSSAGYFREAPGPLGTVYRNRYGDPDQELLARLTVEPLPEGKAPESTPPNERMPSALREDFDNYLVRFQAQYCLEEHQLDHAKKIAKQAEDTVVLWLTYTAPSDPAKRDATYEKLTSEQNRKFPSGEVKRRMTMAERVEEYRAKIAEYEDTKTRKLWVMGKDVEGPKLAQAKNEILTQRKALKKDLDDQVKTYHKALAKILTSEQKALGEVTALTSDPELEWMDLLTRWGITAIGVCLLIGLFTRIASFLGASFLLMTFLAWPAFPWLPGPPVSEGNYVFINKNLVEMFALLVLMASHSGRWFGVDAIINRTVKWLFGEKDEQPAKK